MHRLDGLGEYKCLWVGVGVVKPIAVRNRLHIKVQIIPISIPECPVVSCSKSIAKGRYSFAEIPNDRILLFRDGVSMQSIEQAPADPMALVANSLR